MSKPEMSLVPASDATTVIATSYEPRHEPSRLNDADVKAYEKERRLIHRANARASARNISQGKMQAPTPVEVAQEYLRLTGDK